MNRGLLKVTPEFIAERLLLPPGTEIAGTQWDLIDRTIVFDVRHPDLPDTPDREPAVLVNAPRMSWR